MDEKRNSTEQTPKKPTKRDYLELAEFLMGCYEKRKHKALMQALEANQKLKTLW